VKAACPGYGADFLRIPCRNGRDIIPGQAMPQIPPDVMLTSQRFLMPAVICLMAVIAAVFYVRTAQDDVDRYPRCFIEDCSHLN
jgi:hypothetical protein